MYERNNQVEQNIFETKNIKLLYLKMAIPVVLGMVVTLIYNLVDTYYISQTNNTALISGVSICAPLFTFMLAVGDIFGLGGSSVISRLLGEGKIEEARKKSSFCFYSSIICSLFITFFMLIFKPEILSLLGATNETFFYAESYYKYLVLGSVTIIFSLVPSNLLRTEGYAVTSMAGTIFGTIVNIILDPIFIFKLNYGAAGAAIATIIGYSCTCAFFIFFIAFKSKKLSIRLSDLSFDFNTMRAILFIGLPASITNLMQTIGLTLTNNSLNRYGYETVALMGVVLKVVNIATLIIVGLAFGGQPIFGYNYGAKKYAKLKETILFGMSLTAGTGIVFALTMSVFSNPIISHFFSDESLILSGAQMLRMQMIGIPLFAISLVITCCFQSTGKALSALLLSICRQGIVFVIVIKLLMEIFGLNGIIISQSVSDIVTVFIALILFRISLGKELFGSKEKSQKQDL